LQAQINALSALVDKEHWCEAELELELAQLQHANMLDEMLELQVTHCDCTLTAIQGGMFQ